MENIWHMLPGSPMRHVFARRNGAMVFGGGGGPSLSEIKTMVTGVVNPQFTSLGSGQSDITSGIGGIADDIAGLSKDLRGAKGDITKLQDRNLVSMSDQLTTGFNTAQNTLNDQSKQLGTLETNQGLMQGSIDSGFEGVGTALADNYANTTQNLTDVGTFLGSNIDNLRMDNQGNFDTTNENLANMSTQLGDAQTAITQGQADNTTQLATQADTIAEAQAQAAEERQKANLEGQQGISGQLDTLSTNQDTYYGDLAEKAQTMQGTQDDFRTAFDTYKQQYDTDTGIANTARQDLQTSLIGLGNSMFNQNEALNQNISEGTAEVVRGVEDSSASAMSGMRSIEQAMANNGINNEQIMGGLQTMTELMQSPDVSDAAKVRFRDVMNAFDQNGNLVSRSQGSDGSLTFRSLDDNGMLKVGKYDASGVAMSNQSFDMPKMVSDLTNLRSSLNGGGMMS